MSNSFIDNINKNLAGIISQIKKFPKNKKIEQPLPVLVDNSINSTKLDATNALNPLPLNVNVATNALKPLSLNANVVTKPLNPLPLNVNVATNALKPLSLNANVATNSSENKQPELPQPQTQTSSIYNNLIDKYNKILTNILKKKSGNNPPAAPPTEPPAQPPAAPPAQPPAAPPAAPSEIARKEEPTRLSGSTIITINDRLNNTEKKNQIDEMTSNIITNKLKINEIPIESEYIKNNDNIDSTVKPLVMPDNDGLVKGNATIETETIKPFDPIKTTKNVENLTFV